MKTRWLVYCVMGALCVSGGTALAAAVNGGDRIVDNPVFSSHGRSMWNPDGGQVAEKTFRQPLINLDLEGTLGEFIGVAMDAEPAEAYGPLQYMCPEGAFPLLLADVVNCYSCPEGYQHDAFYSSNIEGICWKYTARTTAIRKGDAKVLCPEGQFPDAALETCYSCPDGSVHDPSVAADKPGACKGGDVAHKVSSHALSCDSGHFPNASFTACYDCTGGYSHNPLLSVNTKGVCYKTTWKQECTTILGEKICSPPYPSTSYKTATYMYALGCGSGEFSGGAVDPNGCYECKDGYEHLGILPVNTIGVCYVDREAIEEDDVELLCDVQNGEFFDTETADCYACPAGYQHDIGKYASETGVCFKKSLEVAEEDGLRGDFCPPGTFFDVTSGICYSCEDGYSWNPMVPVEDSGACVNWDSLQVEAGASSPDFEVGYQVDYDITHIDGIEGGIWVDPGSVNIDFTPRVTVDIEPYERGDDN